MFSLHVQVYLQKKVEYPRLDAALHITNSVSVSASLHFINVFFNVKKSVISSSLSTYVVVMPNECCRKNA